MANDPPQKRADIEKTVKQMIMLSISLEFNKKEELIKKLPSLTDDQLMKLQGVFENESKQKEALLTDFFGKHPELYPQFERLSKNHASSIYRSVEDDEKIKEQERIQEILFST